MLAGSTGWWVGGLLWHWFVLFCSFLILSPSIAKCVVFWRSAMERESVRQSDRHIWQAASSKTHLNTPKMTLSRHISRMFVSIIIINIPKKKPATTNNTNNYHHFNVAAVTTTAALPLSPTITVLKCDVHAKFRTPYSETKSWIDKKNGEKKQRRAAEMNFEMNFLIITLTYYLS